MKKPQSAGNVSNNEKNSGKSEKLVKSQKVEDNTKSGKLDQEDSPNELTKKRRKISEDSEHTVYSSDSQESDNDGQNASDQQKLRNA